MGKELLLSVSPYIQKYYLSEKYKDLPAGIKDELIARLAVIAEATNCIISIGFYKDGEIFIEECHEDPAFYDDIGAALEIKQMQEEYAELLKSLKLWYMIYHTENGQIVKDIILMQGQKMNLEEILVRIETKYGKDGRAFGDKLLDE